VSLPLSRPLPTVTATATATNSRQTATIAAETMIYLVRHGETELNVAGRHQGHTDSPLTELGRRQARAAGRALAELVRGEGVVIISSPLGRAVATAQLIAETMGLVEPIVVDSDLSEISMGSAEGLNEAEMNERWPGRRATGAADSLSFEAPDGESLESLRSRLERALARARSCDGVCILVSHGVAGRVIRAIHLGLATSAAAGFDAPQNVLFRLEPAKVARVTFSTD
jgi:broad specificity phosphatase PhoE